MSPPGSTVISFDEAVAVLLAHEGGYCNFANDPGGATNWGISRVIRAHFHLTPQDCGIKDFSDDQIKAMPRRAAERIYWRCWWLPWKLWELEDQRVATKLLDFGVNANPPGVAIGFAQQACQALGRDLRVDSQMGSLTRAAINACAPDAWLADYCARQLAFYERILAKKPWMEIPWRRVWTARAAWGRPASPKAPSAPGAPGTILL